jgi:3-deoxy-D-manno-octulosonic-acid transferase
VYLLYSVATLIALVALAPYFLYQALRHNKYVGSLGQRLGYLPVSFNLDAEESIWVHAVSVGEVLAARPIVVGLKARYPSLRVFLSTTTMSGQKLARSVSDADAVFYFPFDFTFIVRKTLNLVKPRLFVMVETEIWPNLLRECRRRNVRTALVNGRISPRSFPRYRMIRPFMRRVLGDIDRFCVQSDESARRLGKLGADASRVTVTGSLKFDSLDPSTAPGRGRERVLRFFRISPARHDFEPVTTSKGEEEAVIRAFNRVRTTQAGNNALLILSARHPERFGPTTAAADAAGLRVRTRRGHVLASPDTQVFVLDTIGELVGFFGGADVAFVGGSLCEVGGHNVLEPAAMAVPSIVGPHTFNFADVTRRLVDAGAVLQVPDAAAVANAVVELLADTPRRFAMGAAGRKQVAQLSGALDATLALLDDVLAGRR